MQTADNKIWDKKNKDRIFVGVIISSMKIIDNEWVVKYEVGIKIKNALNAHSSHRKDNWD